MDRFLDDQFRGELQKPDIQAQKAKEFFASLPDVKIDPTKKRCNKCNQLHTTFCLKCGVLLIQEIEQIELPVPLLVIHHEKEKHQKSSALPVQFLSKQVRIMNFPCDLKMIKQTYILYPHVDARFIKDIPQEELAQISQIVAIDCTWFQTAQILDEIQKQNEDIKYIKLQDYETYFWRYQHHSEKCLATIEAIYYFYKELKLQENFERLLYFYKYNYEQIQSHLEGQSVYQKMDYVKCKRKQKQDKSKKKFVKHI